MADPVRRELDDAGVLLVTFDRPEKKNAFDEAQWDAAAAALREARADGHVAAVVVTGAGGDFSAGVDLGSFRSPPRRDDGFASGYDAFMATLIEFDKPLLAAVRGVGIGIGCTLLFHCDVVHLGESARLRMPFTALGLVPEGASSVLLERIVGMRRAAELLLASEWIDARTALADGIATRVFPDAVVLEATLTRARTLAALPVGSLQATKRTLLEARRGAVEAALLAEREGMAAQVGSPENREAIQAFVEKRPADFRKLRSA